MNRSHPLKIGAVARTVARAAIAVSVVAACVSMTTVAAASSLTGDWQSEDTFTNAEATNPNGVWSYGVYDSGYNGGNYQGGSYSLAAAVQPSTFDPFTFSTSSDAEMAGPGNSIRAGPSGGQPNPAVDQTAGPIDIFNYNAGPDGAGYGFNVPANSLEVLDSYGPVVQHFTAATSGNVTVSATFTDPFFNPSYSGGGPLWSFAAGVPDYLVMHNNTIIADQIATDASSPSFFSYTYDPSQMLFYETFTVNQTLHVSAGDTIDFIVNPQFTNPGVNPAGDRDGPGLGFGDCHADSGAVEPGVAGHGHRRPGPGRAEATLDLVKLVVQRLMVLVLRSRRS